VAQDAHTVLIVEQEKTAFALANAEAALARANAKSAATAKSIRAELDKSVAARKLLFAEVETGKTALSTAQTE